MTVLCAVLLLCANQNAKIKGDAAIAMLSVRLPGRMCTSVSLRTKRRIEEWKDSHGNA